MKPRIFLVKISKFFIILSVTGFLFGCALTTGRTVYIDSASNEEVKLTPEAKEKLQFHIMSIEELVFNSDIIAKVKVIKTTPVYFRFKDDIYAQLANLRVIELLKGMYNDKVIEVYARNENVISEDEALYEIYDELVVFLKKDDNHYFTLNDRFGQMPIYNKMITNWRIKNEGKLVLDVSLPYPDVKKNIQKILLSMKQFEQSQKISGN